VRINNFDTITVLQRLHCKIIAFCKFREPRRHRPFSAEIASTFFVSQTSRAPGLGTALPRNCRPALNAEVSIRWTIGQHRWQMRHRDTIEIGRPFHPLEDIARSWESVAGVEVVVRGGTKHQCGASPVSMSWLANAAICVPGRLSAFLIDRRSNAADAEVFAEADNGEPLAYDQGKRLIAGDARNA
jgi:hypothetical protein